MLFYKILARRNRFVLFVFILLIIIILLLSIKDQINGVIPQGSIYYNLFGNYVYYISNIISLVLLLLLFREIFYDKPIIEFVDDNNLIIAKKIVELDEIFCVEKSKNVFGISSIKIELRSGENFHILSISIRESSDDVVRILNEAMIDRHNGVRN